MQHNTRICIAFLLAILLFLKNVYAKSPTPIPRRRQQRPRPKNIREIIGELDVFPAKNYEVHVFEKFENDSRKKMEKVGGAQGCVMFRKQRPRSRTERPLSVAIKHVTNEMGLRLVIREVEALKKGPDINVPEVFVVMNLLGFNNLEKVISNCKNVPPQNPAAQTDGDNNSDLMEGSPAKVFTEQEICENFRRLLITLYHLHKINMLHCDIKPLNLVLDKSYRIFMTDFGLATILDSNNWPTNFCGTRQTMSPEMFENLFNGNVFYTFSADIWSAFVVLWMWFTNDLRGPFYHRCAAERCIRKHSAGEVVEFTLANMKRPMPMPDSIPEKAANLIRRVLVYDQRKRPSLEEIMEDEWFKSHNVTFPCLSPDHKIEDHGTERLKPQLHRRKPRKSKESRSMSFASLGTMDTISSGKKMRDDLFEDPDEIHSNEEEDTKRPTRWRIISETTEAFDELAEDDSQSHQKSSQSREISDDKVRSPRDRTEQSPNLHKSPRGVPQNEELSPNERKSGRRHHGTGKGPKEHKGTKGKNRSKRQ